MTISILSSLVLIAVCNQPVQDLDSPRREPATAVTNALQLLEKKDYVGFLKTYMRPNDLKQMTASRSIETFAAEFGERRAAKLVTILREASTLQPLVDAGRTRADYNFAKPVEGEATLSLRKIDGYWYIR